MDDKHVYENNLGIDKLSRMFLNKSQSYKFYWFEAILNLLIESDEITFDDIINEMICEAWHTVTHFHLRLGPTVNGNAENFLEHAINLLNENSPKMTQNPSNEELKYFISECNDKLKYDKRRLTDYVPYKLLSPFFDVEGLEEGLDYILNDKHTLLIEYMGRMPQKDTILYTIVEGEGLQKKVKINPYWRKFLLENHSIIKSWVQYNKIIFLQDRNPGVPGIVYKLESEIDEKRKLDKVRDLWKTVESVTGSPLKDIYTGSDIDSGLSIDHFVPRSYVSNDELWNLIPMSKKLNSSKNNKLPVWDVFFKPFVKYQFYLYNLVFPTEGNTKNDILIDKFEKCRKDNLNSIWASQSLYIPGNSYEQFTNILSHNLKPVYEAAELQGYEIWRIKN